MMDELLNHLFNEIRLDSFLANKQPQSNTSKKKAISFNFLTDSATKLKLWPIILKIPHIYITRNQKVIHDNRASSDGGCGIKLSTLEYLFFDEEPIITITASKSSIINLFFKNSTEDSVILSSPGAFFLLQLISRARKTGITQSDLGAFTKIDPRSDFYQNKANKQPQSNTSKKKAISFNFLTDSATKLKLWPIILKIPHIYITRNQKVIHDNRASSDGGCGIKLSTLEYLFFDEEPIITITASKSSIINLFFKNSTEDSVILSSPGAFFLLQLISRARKTGITQSDLGAFTKIDPRSVFYYIKLLEETNIVYKISVYHKNLNTNNIVLNYDHLFTNKKTAINAEATTDVSLVELDDTKFGITDLVIEILMSAKDSSLTLYNIYLLMGLDVNNQLHIKFFKKQIISMTNLNLIEIYHSNKYLSYTPHSNQKNNLVQIMVCYGIKLSQYFFTSKSMDRYQKIKSSSKNNNISLASRYDLSNRADADFLIENFVINRLDVEFLELSLRLNKFFYGINPTLSPEIQVLQLAYAAKENGLTIKTLRDFFRGINHRYLNRIILKYNKNNKKDINYMMNVLESVGRESRNRHFINQELLQVIENLVPPPVVQHLKTLPNLESFNELISFQSLEPEVYINSYADRLNTFVNLDDFKPISEISALNNNINYLNNSNSNDLNTDQISTFNSPSVKFNQSLDTPKNLERQGPKLQWLVFSQEYLKKYSDSSKRISLNRLIREQVIIDLMEVYEVLDLNINMILQIQDLTDKYIELIKENKVQLDCHYNDQPDDQDNFNGRNIQIKPSDIRSLLKYATLQKSEKHNMCKKSISAIFDLLAFFGYGQIRILYTDNKLTIPNCLDTNINHTLLKSPGVSTNKKLLFINSLDLNSKHAKDLIKLISDNQISNYYNERIDYLNSLHDKLDIDLESDSHLNAKAKNSESEKIYSNYLLHMNLFNSTNYDLDLKSYNQTKNTTSNSNSLISSDISLKRKHSDLDGINSNESSNKSYDRAKKTNLNKTPKTQNKILDKADNLLDFEKYKNNSCAELYSNGQSSLNLCSNTQYASKGHELTNENLHFLEVTLNSFYISQKLTKAKILHAFLIDNAFDKKILDERVYSGGRFVSNYLIYGIPLFIFFTIVRARRLNSFLIDYLNGDYDSEIDPQYFKFSFFFVNPNQSVIFNENFFKDFKYNKKKSNKSTYYSFAQRLSVPIGKLPTAVSKSLLDEVNRVLDFMPILVGILVRLELLRPIHIKSLVSEEPLPISHDNFIFLEGEQENLLHKYNLATLSNDSTKIKIKQESLTQSENTYNTSKSPFKKNSVEKNPNVKYTPKKKAKILARNQDMISQKTVIKTYTEWTRFLKVSCGYQLMKISRMRDFRVKSVLPPYLSNRYYYLLDQTHLYYFWEDIKNLSLNFCQNLLKLPSIDLDLSSIFEPYNVGLNKDSDRYYRLSQEIITTDHIKHEYDPLSYLEMSFSFSGERKMPVSIKNKLLDYIDYTKFYTPLRDSKLCNDLARKLNTGLFQIKSFFYNFESNFIKMKNYNIERKNNSNKNEPINKFTNINEELFEYYIEGTDNKIELKKIQIQKINEKFDYSLIEKFIKPLKFTEFIGIFSPKGANKDSIRILEGYKNKFLKQPNKSRKLKSILYNHISDEFDFDPESISKYSKRFILQQAYLSHKLRQVYEFISILRYFKIDIIQTFLGELVRAKRNNKIIDEYLENNDCSSKDDEFQFKNNDLSMKINSKKLNDTSASCYSLSPEATHVNIETITDENHLNILNKFRNLDHFGFKMIGRLLAYYSLKPKSYSKELPKNHSTKMWSELDSNRLLLSVVIVDYFYKHYSIPLSWNLVLIAFKDNIEYYKLQRFRTYFSILMKVDKNMIYFKIVQKIFEKLRPLCVKIGVFKDFDKLLESKKAEYYRYRDMYKKQNKFFDQDSSSTGPNEALSGINKCDIPADGSEAPKADQDLKIDIFDETNYLVGILFYYGIPYLMDLFQINDLESSKESIKTNEVFFNQRKKVEKSFNSIQYKDLNELLSLYRVEPSSKLLVYKSNIKNDKKSGMHSATTIEKESDYVFKETSKKLLQNYFYEDADAQYTSMRLVMFESFKNMLNLRASWLSTLNYPLKPSVFRGVSTNDFNKLDSSCNILSLFFASIQAMKIWQNMGGCLSVSDSKLNLKTFPNQFLFLSHSYTTALDSNDRLLRFYPFAETLTEFLKSAIQSRLINNSIFNQNTNYKILYSPEFNLNKLDYYDNNKLITDFDLSNSSVFILHNKHSLTQKNINHVLSPQVSGYTRNIVLQTLLFILLMTPDKQYDSEYFYNLILGNICKSFCYVSDLSYDLEDTIFDLNLRKLEKTPTNEKYLLCYENDIFLNLYSKSAKCKEGEMNQIDSAFSEIGMEKALNLVASTTNLLFRQGLIFRNNSNEDSSFIKTNAKPYIIRENNMINLIDIIENTKPNIINVHSQEHYIDSSTIKNKRAYSIDSNSTTQPNANVDSVPQIVIESPPNLAPGINYEPQQKLGKDYVNSEKKSTNDNSDKTLNCLEEPKFSVKGFKLSSKFFSSISIYGFSEIFYFQSKYTADSLRKRIDSEGTSLNESVLSIENNNNNKLISNKFFDMKSDITNNDSDLLILPKTQATTIEIKKNISAGELAYYTEFIANHKADVVLIKNEKPIELSNYFNSWRALFNNLTSSKVCMLINTADCLKVEKNILTGISFTKNYMRSGFPFDRLISIISQVVKSTGAFGATIYDIKLGVLLSVHPPFIVPSDDEIWLALDYLDLYYLLGIKNQNKQSIILDIAFKGINFNKENFLQKFKKTPHLYRVGFRETRYVTEQFIQIWCIDGIKLNSLDSIAHKSIPDSDSKQHSIYCTKNDNLLTTKTPPGTESEHNLFPQADISILDANFNSDYNEKDKSQKVTDTDDSSSSKDITGLIPAKIWFGTDSKINGGLIKVISEAIISLIATKPGIGESAINRKINQSLSNAEISEILDYLISQKIIIKKTLVPEISYLKLSTIQQTVFSNDCRKNIISNLNFNPDSIQKHNSNLSGLYSEKDTLSLSSIYNCSNPYNADTKKFRPKPGDVLFEKSPIFKLVHNNEISMNLISCYWIFKWISDTEAGTSCNWIELEIVYPELKAHINYVFKIRNRTCWRARRYAKSESPFCRNIAPETIENMLFDTSGNKTTIIACFDLNEVSWQAHRVGITTVSTRTCKDPTVRYVNTELTTAKFLNAIALPRYLMLNGIRLAPIPPNQCPPAKQVIKFIKNLIFHNDRRVQVYQTAKHDNGIQIISIPNEKKSQYPTSSGVDLAATQHFSILNDSCVEMMDYNGGTVDDSKVRTVIDYSLIADFTIETNSADSKI
ncbi:hypothetical protein BB561_006149 [Smittium simulii]|uniref:B-block binding subunit of TFIIIC domain-containing protein n=1 Tax=Smittium simulii TaxID=133385 RepID=A0A2T9Y667_9FUNG|nr:hypothetical protein BB561_006149 [Smittium simulii]